MSLKLSKIYCQNLKRNAVLLRVMAYNGRCIGAVSQASAEGIVLMQC